MSPENAVINIIRTAGAVSAAEYMRLCLSHPEYGYYTAKHDIFGREGDFITAPGLGGLFGETLGVWCADMYAKLGAPPAFALIEPGPGAGECAADVLRATARVNGFHRAARMIHIDISPVLREKQRQAVAPYLPSLGGYAHYDTLEKAFTETAITPLICYANEFPDALPVRQYVCDNEGRLYERLITADAEGRLRFVRAPAPAKERPYSLSAERIAPLLEKHGAEHAVFEHNPGAETFFRTAAEAVKRRGGAFLCIDYGYSEPPGLSSLQALRGHRKTHIFDNPGQCDITALVDFGAADRIFSAYASCYYSGVITQGDFLHAFGIKERVNALAAGAPPEKRETLFAQYRRLTGGDAMGTLFKAVMFAAPVPE